MKLLQDLGSLLVVTLCVFSPGFAATPKAIDSSVTIQPTAWQQPARYLVQDEHKQSFSIQASQIEMERLRNRLRQQPEARFHFEGEVSDDGEGKVLIVRNWSTINS